MTRRTLTTMAAAALAGLLAMEAGAATPAHSDFGTVASADSALTQTGLLAPADDRNATTAPGTWVLAHSSPWGHVHVPAHIAKKLRECSKTCSKNSGKSLKGLKISQ